MRKGWRWLLGSLAAIVALLGLFVWDAIRRAEAAIDAHERQLALDIAALRAVHGRGTASPNQLPAVAMLGDPAMRLQALVSSGLFYPYEKEDSRDDWLHYYLIPQWRHHPQVPSSREVLDSLSFSHDWIRGGGIERAVGRSNFETRAINEWRRLLGDTPLLADHPRDAAQLMDRIERERPPIREALEGERILDKLRVIRVLRTRSDPEVTLTAEPDWKCLFLWRIFIARTLTAVDRMYREASAVETLPLRERPAAAARIDQELQRSSRYPSIRRWPRDLRHLYGDRLATLNDWTLMRLATAICWFEIETEQYPKDLEALVPQYINRVPVNPSNGESFSYSNGVLSDRESGSVWKISRKSEPRKP